MFKPYNSIENTYREEYLARIRDHGFGGGTYIVQEKAHGANLSFFSTNGVDFGVAKRTGPVVEAENFYGAPLLRDELLPKLRALWTLLAEDDTLQQLNVFGELIGGNYLHPEVPRNTRVKMVQKGIQYTPNRAFYGFDIVRNGTDFENTDRTEELFRELGFLYARTLFRGSLEDCLRFPNDFQSVIPAQLGLPPVEDNSCEGVVIRPVETCFLNNGNRVLLKNKSVRWKERSQKARRERTERTIPEHVADLQDELRTYLTENRLLNVLSKMGPVSIRDFGRVMGAFSNDAWTDFGKDFGARINVLEKEDLKLLKQTLGKDGSGVVRGYLLTLPRHS